METAVNDKPRFRNDLVAQYIEDGGVQYVDVTDPNSGNTFRFYDVEYSIACAMNGDRDLPGLVEWTRAELGLETSADELMSVVSTLTELGYLDGAGENGESFELGAPGKTDFQAQPTVRGGVPVVELGAPGAGAASDLPVERSVRSGGVEDVELGAPGKSDLAVPRPEPIPGPPLELGAPGRGEAAPARPAKPAGTADDMSFAGLMDDIPSMRTDGPRPGPVPKASGAAAPAPSPAKTPSLTDLTPPPAEPPEDMPLRQATARVGADDEPTNIPKPQPEPDDEDVSVDLSAHISLDRNQVHEAVRQSRVMEVPKIPTDLLEDERKDAAAVAVMIAEAADEIDGATKPAMPLPAPPATSQLRALDDELMAARGAETPGSGTVPVRAATPVPINETRAPRPMEPPKKGGSGALFAVLLLLVAAGGGVYWWFFMRQPPAPAPKATTPAPSLGSQPPGGTPAPAVAGGPTIAQALPVAALVERAAAAADSRAAVDGLVAWIAAGSEVAADAPVVKLQGFTRWENQKTQASKRLEFYSGELEKAKAQVPPNAAAVSANEKKVEEKQGLVAQAEEELTKLVVPAAAAGKLEVLVKVGTAVKAGDVVARVAGGAPALVATFEAGKAAADYQTSGAACAVAAQGAPDKRSACLIENVSGGTVTVRLVEGSPFRTGDQVELQRAK